MPEPFYECPVCRHSLMGPDEACDGTFTERDHPSGVRAVQTNVRVTVEREGLLNGDFVVKDAVGEVREIHPSAMIIWETSLGGAKRWNGALNEGDRIYKGGHLVFIAERVPRVEA